MAYELYGEHGTPGTVRTEIHRVRRRLEVLVALAGRIGIDPAGAARSAEEAVRLSREMGD